LDTAVIAFKRIVVSVGADELAVSAHPATAKKGPMSGSPERADSAPPNAPVIGPDGSQALPRP
jgi:hypothetical protein